MTTENLPIRPGFAERGLSRRVRHRRKAIITVAIVLAALSLAGSASALTAHW
jgi:hypothetical protein